MTQEMTQECVKGTDSMECFEVEVTSLEPIVLNPKSTPEQASIGVNKPITRIFVRISKYLQKHSENARSVEKSKYNPRYQQEGIPIARVNRRAYDNTPRMY